LRAGFLVRAVALTADLLPFAAFGVETESLRYTVPLYVLYDVLLTAGTGGTLGKWLLGLHVVDDEGKPLDVTKALLRTLARALSFATLAGPLLALGKEKRALHDQLVGTTVEYRGASSWPERQGLPHRREKKTPVPARARPDAHLKHGHTARTHRLSRRPVAGVGASHDEAH
jgi:uncharacterized RDD family membrane protein YckC